MPFSVLTAAQQDSPCPGTRFLLSFTESSSPLTTRLTSQPPSCLPACLPFTPRPIRLTVMASAVHRRRDPCCVPVKRARSRRRASPTSAHTSAARICVTCYATLTARSRPSRGRIHLSFLSPFLSPLLRAARSDLIPLL